MKYFLFILIFLCPLFSLASPDTAGQAQRKSDSIFYAKSRLDSIKSKEWEFQFRNEMCRKKDALRHEKTMRTFIWLGGLAFVLFVAFLIIFLVKKFS